MNTRRKFLVTLGAGALICLLALPRSTLAQQVGRVYRIGILDSTGRLTAPYYLAFKQQLNELGFVEGRNLVIDSRTSEGRIERLPELGAELAQKKCDVLVAPGNEANLIALEQATRDTPIVVIAVDYDPEATGQIASLAHPGGRITGVSALQTVLPAKRLELLKELLPRARKIAVFSDASSAGQLEVARIGAKRLGVELKVHEFKRAPYDYESAFAEAIRVKADALLMLGSANFVPARPLITELARKHRLPAVFHNSVWADSGGLLSYGPNFSDIFRLAAEQVSKILKGVKPADLPVEQPTKFELVINRKTAKALGIAIPMSLLIRADKVIE